MDAYAMRLRETVAERKRSARDAAASEERKRRFIDRGTAEIMRSAGEGWWDDPARITARGAEEGVRVIPNQPFDEFRCRVLAASGPGPWIEAQDSDTRARIEHWRSVGVNPPTNGAATRQPLPQPG